MSVSYRKLIDILEENDIQYKVMKIEADITTSEAAKINKDEYLRLDTIERLIKYLSVKIGKQVKIDDILEFK